ncbi:glycosyltransferase family 9 protein [Phytopseudomonas punonensis]|uniref:Glycosyltransferase family 9 (Heptosyltransferase) n=1 Tax=Phytopseudomonas punonensis TaxID=1220495 RepID=A0A1M7HSP1_9GAMM|nr:glycosyltransferase family 9 protein [Pseudomonas punonensis]SHM31419.1 Glycosyltransferase family 9 (heptosyltransferase) [Pseudomonas punonensis]
MLEVLKHADTPLSAVPADCRIALIPSMGLGDGCIYLVLAANLARAGYQVTVLSNHLGALNDWLPLFETRPLPAPSETFAVLDGFDLVISDMGSMLTRHGEAAGELARRYVFVGTLKVDPRFVEQPAVDTLAHLPAEKSRLLAPLAAAAGPLRCLDDDSVSMVNQAVAFCRLRLGLLDATDDIGLQMPASLVHRRHARRVMLHPLSYNAKKNWPAPKYLALARRLKAAGYQPQFVLSPKERCDSLAAFAPEFEVPEFADAKALAAHLYESGFVIGNDSGVGHLASALGIPVLTLYRKRRDGFCWRPGWGDGLVVRPVFSLSFMRDKWAMFMSVGRVAKGFRVLSEKVGGGQ